MRIFAGGDFHGDKSHVRKLVEHLKTEKLDAIFLNGDLVEEHDVEGVVGVFASLGKPLFIIPGNHESLATTDFFAMRYGARNLHASYTVLGDIGVAGMGGAEVGVTIVTEDEIYGNLETNMKSIAPLAKKIILSHMPPTGTAMADMSPFVRGSPALRAIVEKFSPDIVICGHVHEASGLEETVGKTKVINVGRYGKILEL